MPTMRTVAFQRVVALQSILRLAAGGSNEAALAPRALLDRHLHGRHAPVDPMIVSLLAIEHGRIAALAHTPRAQSANGIVARRRRSGRLAIRGRLVRQPCARARLRLGQAGEHAEDDGDAAVELDAHEAVRDRVADVFKVHRRALDEHADRNHRVKGAARACVGCGFRRAGVAGAREEVAGGGDELAGGCGLRGGQHALGCEGELEAAGARLRCDVGGRHAGVFEGLVAPRHEGGDDGGVPARVDDADAQVFGLRGCGGGVRRL